jgi:multisubunit Na+/H+ antiporter MnhC subunit
MELFNYVMVLASIVIGLAITHLLQGVARIVQHPGRDKIY